MSPQAQNDCTWFKNVCGNSALVAKLKSIKLIISDVDGTLTDAGIYVDGAGEGGRVFSVQDGYCIAFAQQTGLRIGFMSGKNNPSLLERGRKLGIPEDLLVGGELDKPSAIGIIQKKYGLHPEETLIIGDDQLDVMVKHAKKAALFITPSNAPFYIQAQADAVVPRHGGDSAFRLLLDVILYLNKAHFAQEVIQNLVNHD